MDDIVLDRTQPSIPDHVEQIAVREELEQRLRQLPRRRQAALVLRYLEGLDYADAARILDCAEGTVRAAPSTSPAPAGRLVEAGVTPERAPLAVDLVPAATDT